MTSEHHLDGNALGSLLIDVFGQEMTDQLGACGSCGNVAAVGTLLAYRDAPGDVARCSSCGAVLFVAVTTPGGLRLTFESLRWIELPSMPKTSR
jgi:hypothetical protein